tara:strand:- start:22 stop:561 length:540 start_codon:yes stop_codon:yes gene_type:complete
MNWTGAFAPGTVGGRRAHPPKSEKRWWKDMNKKEKQKALRSAIASTMDLDTITKRGHTVPKQFPFIVDDTVEKIKKTKEIITTLEQAGLGTELQRSKKKTIRAGKGKRRGRKYAKKKGVLFVVAKNCGLIKAGKNIPGTDITIVNRLNTKLLAPGGNPGRLTIWSKSAIERMAKEKLFS